MDLDAGSEWSSSSRVTADGACPCCGKTNTGIGAYCSECADEMDERTDLDPPDSRF